MGWSDYLQDVLSTFLASILAFVESGVDLGNGDSVIMRLTKKAGFQVGSLFLITVACIEFEERWATYSITTCDIQTQPR